MGGDREALRHRGLKRSSLRRDIQSYGWVLVPFIHEVELTMKDLFQVLSQKEMDIERVRKEIKALHFVIPLLSEDADWSAHGVALRSVSQLGGTGTPGVKGQPRREHDLAR
jgi:hypothetical protein